MKIFYLLLLSSILIMSSCNSNDDNNSTDSSSIVGKWNIYGISWLDANGNIIDEAIWIHDCSSKKDFYQFNSDGTCERAEHNNDCGLDNHSYVVSWEQNGNLITMTNTNFPYESYISEIVLLNDNTLKLKFTDAEGQPRIVECKKQ